MKPKTADPLRCTRCNEVLNPARAKWLELSQTDGNYYEEIPSGHISQGGFSFGSACAKAQLQETANSLQLSTCQNEMIPLENLLVSRRVELAWKAYCPIAMSELITKYPGLARYEIPNEQFRVKLDGSGQIFVKVRDLEISMNVPAGEWKIKD